MDLVSAVKPGGLVLNQSNRAFFFLPDRENCGENSGSPLFTGLTGILPFARVIHAPYLCSSQNY